MEKHKIYFFIIFAYIILLFKLQLSYLHLEQKFQIIRKEWILASFLL